MYFKWYQIGRLIIRIVPGTPTVRTAVYICTMICKQYVIYVKLVHADYFFAAVLIDWLYFCTSALFMDSLSLFLLV